MRFAKPTRLRWLSQIIFFFLFLFLLLRAEFRGSLRASTGDIRLPYPVNLFFRLDPLVALANAPASHALYHGLLWSLLILVATIFLGRFFCGSICPLGSIHHFFSSLKSERKRGKQLLKSNRYKRRQTTKYYLLAAGLVAAMFGTGILGWLDPFSLLVRSLGLSILPATGYSLRAVLRVLERSPFSFVQSVGGALHFILGAVLLSFKQPYFRQGIWQGIIFVYLVALNFRITRFWCRALCPLGALLGLVSRGAIVESSQDEGTVMSKRKLRHGATLMALCLALFPNVSCNRQTASPTALFPASGEVAGWSRTSDIRTFEAADLWKYIDGEAERYLKAGAQRVSTADYKFQNKVETVVDIYTMAHAQGAAKIFESEPAAEAKTIHLGDSARLYDQSLFFRKGPNLVRIVAYEDLRENSQAMVQLGQSIERRLPE